MRNETRKRSLYENSFLYLERLILNYMKTRIFTMLFAATLICSCSVNNENIKVNQVGFYPQQEKTFTLESGNRSETVSIHRAENGEKVWEGTASYSAVSPWSGKTRKVYDFSDLNETGRYVIKAGKESKEITISETALKGLSEAALLGFYHQRSGMDLDPAVAGQWARKGGHPDTLVYVHAGAAGPGRPEGTVISSPKGWYDAGDYNKYVVNSGYSMGLMYNTFLMHGSQLADAFYDEMEYNMEWMLTMQDPSDGGVYHKLTTPSFEGFISPSECRQKRYVVQKSVTASLDYAAALSTGPSKDLEKAEAAYKWAKANPDAFYDQDRMNAVFDPDVVTGAYGDSCADDEFFWAASALFHATGKAEYLNDAKRYMPERFSLMSWGNVSALGVFDWLHAGKMSSDSSDRKAWEEHESEIYEKCRQMLLDYCDMSIEAAENSCYNSAYGNRAEDFHWGCCSSFCDQAICFLYAYDLTGERRYLDNAFRNVNHILGQNATGYCYVTGFGSKSPMFPHSRLCHTDGVEAPIPGLLVGGPNPGQQDIAEVGSYSSDYPDESYEDVMPSYASNEIAINWNASLVAVTSWLSYLGEGLAK